VSLFYNYYYVHQSLLIGSSSLGLSKPSAGLNSLSLPPYGRLFISPSQLEFLEQTAFRQFVFQNLEGLIDIIIDDFDFQVISPFLLWIC